MNDIEYAAQLYGVYLEAGGSCLKGDEPFPDHFPGQCNICGLLAVAEFASRGQTEAHAALQDIRTILHPDWLIGRVLPQYLGAASSARISAIGQVLSEPTADSTKTEGARNG